LGCCFALELARAGASVAAGDLNEQGLEQLSRAASEFYGRLTTRKLDVSQESSVSEFVQRAIEDLDYINVLVNNAGVLRDGLIARSEEGWIKKLPSPQWKQVLDVNLTGPFLMARETLAHIFERKIAPAVIVNISSASRAGNAGQSNYSASKAGLDALTRTWALELAPFGIRVGGIAPGVTDTPMLRKVDEAVLKQRLETIPLGRIGAPMEIWLALKFILECDYFTGRTIEVDGGGGF
jgi:3-oxoacyl-[acyl-carrier protein] reductase